MSMTSMGVLALALSLAGGWGVGNAKSPPTTVLRNATDYWSPGDRIRVTAPEPYFVRWTGWFSSVEADSVLRMTLTRGEPPVGVRLSQIGTLEDSGGKRRAGRNLRLRLNKSRDRGIL